MDNKGKMTASYCIKKIQTPIGFLAALGFATFVHGFVINGILNVNVSTIERRYHMRSYQSGLISSSYDIAFCVLCPLVTYYGNHHHRPRIMVAGMLIFAFGCAVNILPHFLSGRYIAPQNQTTDLCTSANETSPATSDKMHTFFYVFVSGYVLLGIGSIPIISLGLAYLEDSTTKQKAASYIGLVGGVSSFGSVIGYLIGGFTLSIYVDFHSEKFDDSELTSEDPMWVGAWWISLFLAVCLALISMMLFLLFPKKLTTDIPSRGVSETHIQSGSAITEHSNFGKTIQDFPTAFKLLLKNPTFLFTILGASCETFLLNGFAVFLPKLLQNQFSISPTKAALMAGSVSVPGAIIGHVVSGYIVRRFSMKAPRILLFICVATVLSSILTPTLLLHCPRNVSKEKSALWQEDDLLCERNCSCNEEIFQPVCGDDAIEYFSACHAGCREHDSDSTIFYNCSCISSRSSNSTGQAIKGTCDSQCSLLVIFLVLLFLLVSLSFSVLTPSVVVVMRCVPYSQKTFAVGVQWFFIRIIGSIPSTLVIGAIFDASCAIWRTRDGKSSSCWIYDNETFAKSAVLTAVVCKTLTLGFYTLAYRLYKSERARCNNNEDRDRLKISSSQPTPETEFIQI